MLLHCLWYGNRKPRMDTYLQPFVQELRILHDDGFTWNHQGLQRTTKVCLGLCVCDSVARPVVQNMKQFNGASGCSFCYHQGELKTPGQLGNARIYPISDDALLPPLRTHESFVIDAQQAVHVGHPHPGCERTFGVAVSA